MKDAGRDTDGADYSRLGHCQTPLFSVDVADVQFRKLNLPFSAARHAMPAGISAVLGEAMLKRCVSKKRVNFLMENTNVHK